MITTQEFKKLLNDYDQKLSDEEVEKIRQDMYIFADIAFDFWEKDKGLKNSRKQKDVV